MSGRRTPYGELRAHVGRIGREGWTTFRTADVLDVLDNIAALCDGHTTCEHCGDEICTEHLPETTVVCGTATRTGWHCDAAECFGRCGWCQEAYRESEGLPRFTGRPPGW